MKARMAADSDLTYWMEDDAEFHVDYDALIIRSDIVVRILPIVFGLFVIFDSLGRIQNALELRKCQYPSWKGFLLLAVLSIVLGIVMILDPFGTMETLVMAIGVILIVEDRKSVV